MANSSLSFAIANAGVIKMTRKIWVTFSKIGYHNYPDAPDVVDYLRIRHRHLFKFKVMVTVEHNDREIEFHMFLNWCLAQYPDNNDNGLVLNYASCEMIATALCNAIREKYGAHREVEVEVSEDGECGAIITMYPVFT